ncbi:LysR family transcriptional regulator [Devosia sp.]|uniref:LysR family transcriptional regulator n=1 Tax=Devosia sp. TaxID=1871048 RepID=UPI002AFFCFE9|nr:LysR family transcriptional regulator [Devosia sp.]
MKANLRHLRTFLSAVETGSITRAAEFNNVSQPAVTQAIRKLEQRFGMALFERTPRGLFATEAGKVLAERTQRALSRLDIVLQNLAPRLSLTATSSQLTALIAAVEAENFTLAARRLGLAQPTVHRAIAELEQEAGRELFERTSRGMLASRAAANLAHAAELAFAEIEQADAAMGELAGREVGRIAVGAMPLSRASILPMAIAGFRKSWPTLPIRAVEGPYRDLLDGLRRGQLDFLIGALRNPAPAEDVDQELLFVDELVAVCGPGHPVLEGRETRLDRLAEYPWMVAPAGTPSRAMFDRIFSGAMTPASIVETSSVILMRETLAISNHLGFVSAGQVISDVRLGSLVRLPLDLHETARPIGLSTRSGWVPTRAQAGFVDEVRAAARQIGADGLPRPS